MEHVFIFIFGLVLGSFANVIILRLNTGESVIFGCSRCFSCGRVLRWFENIPILSFLLLRGRCGKCGSKIYWQYPMVEFASGFLFLLLWSELGPYGLQNRVLTGLTIIFFWLLFVISVYDLRHKIIPDVLVYISSVIAILYVLSSNAGILIEHFVSGFAFFSVFALLWLVSRGKWMGFGDAKIAFALGLFLGWRATIAAFLFSFWFGAIFGIAYIIIKRSPSFKIQIPFAPFIFLGGLTAHVWGEKIISWYLNLL